MGERANNRRNPGRPLLWRGGIGIFERMDIMIFTEEVARKIVCKRVPVCTYVDIQGNSSQQRSYEEMPIFCIASLCAHWRWWNCEFFDEEKIVRVENRRGYCGLSGKPAYE